MALAKLGQAIIKKVADKKIKILSKIDNLKSKFETSCPPQSELIKIIKQKNQLVSVLNQLKKNVNTIDKTTKPFKSLIKSLDIATKALKLAPIPTAVSGVGIPMGIIVTAGDVLSITKEKIISFKSNIEAFTQIKNYILQTIDQILVELKRLDILIEKCSLKAIDDGTNPQFINNSLNSEDNNLIDNLQDSDSNENNTYNGFKFEILMDTNNDTRFPKRYAVAKTPSGIIMLRGESSFSSSVEVLINELKFIIDRDNLKI